MAIVAGINIVAQVHGTVDTVVLELSNGYKVEVYKSILEGSTLVTSLMENSDNSSVIWIPEHIDNDTLDSVVSYLKIPTTLRHKTGTIPQPLTWKSFDAWVQVELVKSLVVV